MQQARQQIVNDYSTKMVLIKEKANTETRTGSIL